MKQFYFYKLDLLRFFAFFLVFWQHTFGETLLTLLIPRIPNHIIQKLAFTGGIGVHIFFVLSGFLITYLLIQEQNVRGRISIPDFYLRRVLRIWPLYYIIVVSGIFLLPHLFNTFKFCGSVFENVTFLNNFDMHPACASPNVGIAWSVAIEEQFYLVWPLLFYVFYKRNLLNKVCAFFFILSTAFTFINPDYYFHTLGNVNYLMCGCFGAIYYARYQKRFSDSIINTRLSFITIMLTAILLQMLSGAFQILSVINIIVSPFIYLFFVVYLTNDSVTGKPSLVSQLGKYTYGMYLYHPTVIIMGKMLFDRLGLTYKGNAYVALLLYVGSLIAIILFSILSYEYFEKFFLKLKSKYSFVKTRV